MSNKPGSNETGSNKPGSNVTSEVFILLPVAS
jgi:hypothetical protein